MEKKVGPKENEAILVVGEGVVGML